MKGESTLRDLMQWVTSWKRGTYTVVLEEYTDECPQPEEYSVACRLDMVYNALIEARVLRSAEYGYICRIAMKAYRPPKRWCPVRDKHDKLLVSVAEYGVVTVSRQCSEGRCFRVGDVCACAPRSYLDALAHDLRMFPTRVGAHPAVIGAFSLRYLVMDLDKTLTIEEMAPCSDLFEWRGLYDEGSLEIYINPAFYDVAALLARAGLVDYREVALDYAHTVIHELSHYHDHINGYGLYGTWWGNVFGVLLGIPSPAGAEASAEGVADKAVEALSTDEAAVEALVSHFKSRAEDAARHYEDLAEAIEILARAAREIGFTVKWTELFEEDGRLCIGVSPPESVVEAAEEELRGEEPSIWKATRLMPAAEAELLARELEKRGYTGLRAGTVEVGFAALEPVVCLDVWLPDYERYCAPE